MAQVDVLGARRKLGVTLGLYYVVMGHAGNNIGIAMRRAAHVADVRVRLIALAVALWTLREATYVLLAFLHGVREMWTFRDGVMSVIDTFVRSFRSFFESDRALWVVYLLYFVLCVASTWVVFRKDSVRLPRVQKGM